MFSIHSHTRYLVLLVAVAATLYALFGLLTRRRFDRTGLLLLRIFTGVVDLQVLFGIITAFTRPFYPALIGHFVMMIAAAAVAHLGAIRLKKLPETERSYGWLLAATLLPLLLMIGGILSIHRAII
jgi:hypothetical protein